MNSTAVSDAPFGTYSLSGYRKFLLQTAQAMPRSWLNKRLALIMRKMVLQNRIQIIDEEVLGIRMRFFPLENIVDRTFLFLPNFYDYSEFAFLTKNLRPDDVFLDIGANVGIYSLYAAQTIKTAHSIFALEPNPRAYERLRYNVKVNQLTEVIVPLNIGVADQESTFTLSVNPTNMGGATLEEVPGYSRIKIYCKPLKTIVEEQNIRRIDVMKIDIEGAEALALNRFFADVPRSLYPKVIIIESPDNIEFENLGYTLIQRTATHNSIFQLTPVQSPDQISL
jgi:FkbM family methyltransferase